MIRTLFAMLQSNAQAPVLTETQWRELLALADRTQLTLHLRQTPGLPQWIVDEIAGRYSRNAERRRRLHSAYAAVARSLTAAGIEFVLLKGFTHEVGFSLDASARVQYDLDILVRPLDAPYARMTLRRMGYAPHGERSLSEEHGRPFVQPSAWQWRGDYYDPDMPIPVELHEEAWHAQQEHLHPAGIEAFWARREIISYDGLSIPAFAKVDRLAFAALHILRHILRHDAKPAHVLELARFLNLCQVDVCSVDTDLWAQWAHLHSPELRALQTVAFRFAHEWFGCSLPAAVEAEWSGMPLPVVAWFRQCAWSPAVNLVRPNKDTVWLHMALTGDLHTRLMVFWDRMVPVRKPHEEWKGRLRYHTAAFAPALASGVRWWWRRNAPSTASETSD